MWVREKKIELEGGETQKKAFFNNEVVRKNVQFEAMAKRLKEERRESA